MKKAVVLLLFLAAISLELCGCQSEKNIESKESKTSYQSSHETANTDNSNVSDDEVNEYDIYISTGEPYKQGVFTTKEYYSEWINIYCNIPLDMRPDKSFLEAIETNNKIFGQKGELQEMIVESSDGSSGVYIYIISLNKDNETLEWYVKKYYQEINDSYKKNSVNGISISCSGDNFLTYSFLGEDYLLNTRQVETRYNGKLRRALNYWDLFRVKGDHIIFIQCNADQNSGVELENLLSMFTTYDSHFNPDSTSNNESGNADGNNTASSSNSSGNNSAAQPSEPDKITFGSLELPNTRAGNIVKNALSADEWSMAMALITDQETIDLLLPGLNLSMCDDYCFAYDMIGISSQRIIAAKAKPGSEEAVKKAFDGCFEMIKNDPNVSFYPAAQDSVNGAVKGVTSDGYYYIIVHKNGSAIESAGV